jgi:hypothetical protein
VLYRHKELLSGAVAIPAASTATSSSRPTPAASEAPVLSKEAPAPSSLPKEKRESFGFWMSCEYRNPFFSFIVDDDSPSSSPRVYFRLLAIECRFKGVLT